MRECLLLFLRFAWYSLIADADVDAGCEGPACAEVACVGVVAFDFVLDVFVAGCVGVLAALLNELPAKGLELPVVVVAALTQAAATAAGSTFPKIKLLLLASLSFLS